MIRERRVLLLAPCYRITLRIALISLPISQTMLSISDDVTAIR